MNTAASSELTALQESDSADRGAHNRISVLAHLMVEAGRKVAAIEDELKKAQEEYRRIEQEDIPELMRECEVESMTLAGGWTISIEPDFHCGISEDRRERAHAWLDQNDFGGIIKTTVGIPFARDERAAAIKFADNLRKKLKDHDVILGESVHYQTLKAFLRERMAAGDSIPTTLFGILHYTKAKLVAPKKR